MSAHQKLTPQSAQDVTAIDWDAPLVAEHCGGPIPNSPANLRGGTVVPVEVHSSGLGRSVSGIPWERNRWLWVAEDGRTLGGFWRVRNALTKATAA